MDERVKNQGLWLVNIQCEPKKQVRLLFKDFDDEELCASGFHGSALSKRLDSLGGTSVGSLFSLVGSPG